MSVKLYNTPLEFNATAHYKIVYFYMKGNKEFTAAEIPKTSHSAMLCSAAKTLMHDL